MLQTPKITPYWSIQNIWLVTFSGTVFSHFRLKTISSGPDIPIALKTGTTVVVSPFSECWIWYRCAHFSPTACLGLNVSCIPLSSRFQMWDGTSRIAFDSNSDLPLLCCYEHERVLLSRCYRGYAEVTIEQANLTNLTKVLHTSWCLHLHRPSLRW